MSEVPPPKEAHDGGMAPGHGWGEPSQWGGGSSPSNPNNPQLPVSEPAPADPVEKETTERLLLRVLRDMRTRYRNGEDVQLRHLIEPLGSRSAALGSAMLALPFLWPATLGPLSFVVFVLITIMSWQLLHGRDKVVLPERFLRVSIPIKVFRLLTRFLVVLIRWKRKLCRRRLAPLVAGPPGRRICATAMTSGGVLVAVPLPFVPFMNTLPALGVVLVGVGWVEQDGLMTVAGLVSLTIGAILILTVVSTLVFFGIEAFFFISEELVEVNGNGNGPAAMAD